MGAEDNHIWDVAIVGAGPAGSTAALHLARRGHSVLLIDKEQFPRDKVCGDGLIADAIGALKRAGLYAEVARLGYQTRTGTVYSPSRIRFDVEGEYLTLKRYVLDELIKLKAEESGAVFLRSKITNVEPHRDRVVFETTGGKHQPVRARIAIIATGANVELADKLGLVVNSRPSAIALRCYLRSRVEIEQLIISYDRTITPGYAWIFPLGRGEYNVGCGIFYRNQSDLQVNLRDIFHRFITNFPLAVELIKNAEDIGPLKGAMLRCGLTGTGHNEFERVLLIGETIGTTFPFTGEGIGKAMQSGELAEDVVTKALRADDPEYLREFPRRLRVELKPKYLGYAIAENWLSKPWLNDFLARRVQRSKYLQGLLSGVINETADPRDVFSIRGILNSFVR